MGSGMYIIRDDNVLIEMTEQPYDSESRLQELLERYPNLLAGHQMNASSPRRWLLISREVGIPDQDGGSSRWAVDHLFLDQDGIPTLVEVKRSTDTRIRREVVGQMLHYAANAVMYWPVESLRAAFQAQCAMRETDEAQVIAASLGRDDPDALWEQVLTNLEIGRVRMVFVADVVPSELLRIVEFLNEQLKVAQVLAVEIRQYLGPGLQTLIPRVLGQTAAASQSKGTSTSPSRQWDEASFFADLTARQTPEDAAVARRIYDWLRMNTDRQAWGKGRFDGSCYGMLDHAGTPHWTIVLWTSGVLEVPFFSMSTGPFAETSQRMELLNRLNAIPGVQLSPAKITGSPNLPLRIFSTELALRQLFEILDWMVGTIQTSWRS